jgi:1-acyl-sn-glycerol-3-phosphate acyltransferase
MPDPFRVGRFATDSRRDQLRTAAGAVPLVTLAGPWLARLARSGRRERLHRAERRWAAAALRHLRVQLDVEGLEHVDPATAYIVAPLHEGFLDAVALLGIGLDLRFVARDELFDWPTLGRYLSASDQLVVPTLPSLGAHRALLRGIAGARVARESIVMFPQGSILGVEIAFKPGPVRIAERFDLPILPVVITGTHLVWEHPYSPALRYGQRVSLSVLEPIPPHSAAKVWRSTERRMKAIALESGMAPARRFVPERDGWWDGYDYQIDPDFADLAAAVAAHRVAVAGYPAARRPEIL